MTLFVVVLMILSALVIALPAMQGREYEMNPAAAASANIQPNPMLNTNVTWSTYNHGWRPLEYNNGTANLSLNATMSAFYANPISVNPSDVVSPALYNDSWAGQKWLDTANWTAPSVFGSTDTISNPTPTSIEITVNGSKAGAVDTAIIGQTALISQLPSSNTAYLYETIAGYTTSSSPMVGVTLTLYVFSNSNFYAVALNGSRIVNSSIEGSEATDIIPLGTPFMVSFPLSDFSKSISSFANVQPRIQLNIPTQTVSNNYVYLHITGAAITTHLMSLGTTANGTQVEGSFNSIDLASLNPTFSYSSIIDNGYSVAVSQPLQNLTTQQSAINSGSYIEQVEYQGQYNLPTAPDLSYGPANITEHFNVSTSQTQVLDINGVSYLSAITGKNNTVLLLSSVNPNGQTEFLQIVDYTQSQWTSISSPPGIFTLAGIEYYWEELIVAILAIVGVGAGAASRHASNLRKVK